MEDEGRRRKDLTPMSGELRAPADWAPPGPVAEEYAPKKTEKRAPVTRRAVLLQGLRRFALISGGLAEGSP